VRDGWAGRSTSEYRQTNRPLRTSFASYQIAEHRGWEVAHEYHDAGIRGSKGREARPGLDEMLKNAQRLRLDVVMASSIDRLGGKLLLDGGCWSESSASLRNLPAFVGTNHTHVAPFFRSALFGTGNARAGRGPILGVLGVG
jgi:hypothetical protein